jgi:hypothetical protein
MNDPINLQSVIIHSANGWKVLRMACRRVLSSTPVSKGLGNRWKNMKYNVNIRLDSQETQGVNGGLWLTLKCLSVSTNDGKFLIYLSVTTSFLERTPYYGGSRQVS